MSRVVALIPAAGMGRRMGGTVAKQFLPLGDKPVLAHTLLVFQHCPEVDEIIPILSPEDMEICLHQIVERFGITKVKTLVTGGRERQHSVEYGLHRLDTATAVVLVHDGVRPFVTPAMIQKTIDHAVRGECVAVGVPVKDTIKEVGRNGTVKKTLDRSCLWAVQTPQAFPASLLRRAYEHASVNSVFGTDDATLVEQAGGVVRMIMGSYDNIKITTPEDLLIAEEILRRISS